MRWRKMRTYLVTGGGIQSNHVRTTAAAARKAGMDAVGYFFSSPGSDVNGNLLLDRILGARLIYTEANKHETEMVVQRVCDDLRAEGRRPYLIPVGGSTKLGVISYILAVGELLEQLAGSKILRPALSSLQRVPAARTPGVLAGLKMY